MRRVRAGWLGSVALGLVVSFPLVRCSGKNFSGGGANGGQETAGERGEAGTGEGGVGAQGGSNRGGAAGSSSGTSGTGARGGSGGTDGGENGGGTSGSATGAAGGASGCDPTQTSGGDCPSPGGCYLSGDSAECRDSVGTTAPDGICGSAYDCAPGTTCVLRATSVGACAPVCRLGEGCDTAVICTPLALAGGGETTEFGACLNCDPTDSSGGGCLFGSACILYPMDESPSTTICMQTEGLDEGAPCGYLYSCGPGLFCAGEPGQFGTCRRVCRVGSPCDGGGDCTEMGAGEFGVCP